MNLLKKVRDLLSNRRIWIVFALLVLLVWTVRLVALYHVGFNTGGGYSHSSDEVAQQNILWDWQHGYHTNALVGDDNYFLHAPLYVIANNLPLSPTKQLFVTSFVLLGVMDFLIVGSLSGMLRRITKGDTDRYGYALAMSSVFLSSVPRLMLYVFELANSRNVEIGIVVFLLYQLYRAIYDPTWARGHRRRAVILVGILFALLLADDPLFVYDMAVPILLVSLLYYVLVAKRSATYLWVAGTAAGALVGSEILRFLMKELLPLSFVNHQSNIATVPGVLTNLQSFFASGIQILGVNFWGQSYTSPTTILALLYLLLACLAFVPLYLGFLRQKKPLFYAVLLGCTLLTICTFIANSSIVGGGDNLLGRYLIMLAPLEIIGISLFAAHISSYRYQIVFGVVLLSVFLLTASQTVKGVVGSKNITTNNTEFTAITALESHGLTKGYSEYGHAVIDSFLSKHKVLMASVICSQQDHSLYDFPVLNEQAVFNAPSRNSFYLYSPGDTSDCDPSLLVPQLGTPTKIISVGNNEYAAIYNYDIRTKIKP